MSGSTDASTIAERTKLEAELREAREGLDDTYYNHAMDSQSNALDDEMEAYEKSTNDYLTSLRESIKNTELIIEQTFQNVMVNADIVLSEINRLSSEYGFTIDESLKNPWINAAAKATEFKNTSDPSVRNLIDENGIITAFGSEDTKTKLSGVFTTGSGAASQFALDVGTHMGAVKTTVNSYTSPEQAEYLGKKLKYPWEDAESAPKHWSEESQRYMRDEVVNWAEQNYKEQLKQKLDYPWEQATAYTSWGDGITTMLQGKIKESEEAGKQIAKNINVQTSSHEGSPTSPSSPSTPSVNNYIKGDDVKKLQKILNQFFGAKLSVDGSYGPATTSAVKTMQEILRKDSGSKALKVDGLYNWDTKTMMQTYLNKRNVGSWFRENGVSIPAAMYAKGTMGTKSSGFAITDESWIGEEITLAAGKNGQLQYLKKGSAVMPADISANLVEWGKLNPNMMGISNMTEGINLMSSYINKPEIKLDIENFLNVGTVSRDTLPELERLMDKKIDTFAKQLNASIRKFK